MRPGSQRKLTPSTARTAPRFLSWKTLVRPRASIMGASLGNYAREEEKYRGYPPPGQAILALVTVGTLLGVEPVGRDGEHVVALDADAMDEFGRLGARWRGAFGFVGFAHDLILTASSGSASREARNDAVALPASGLTTLRRDAPQGQHPGRMLTPHPVFVEECENTRF